MVNLIGDEYLRDDERWVRHCLEGIVGQTRVIDRRDGHQQGKHDLEADLPDGSIAAIEITSEADAAPRGTQRPPTGSIHRVARMWHETGLLTSRA